MRTAAVVHTHGRYNLFITVFIIFMGPLLALPAQERRWFDDFFIEGTVLHYVAPEPFTEVVQPKTGFRAALGYEFRNFRFAAETGYNRIEGTNPFVLDLRFFPLTFKFGYTLPIRWGLGLQADLIAGILSSQTNHYTNAVEFILEQDRDSPATSPLTGARLYATFTVPRLQPVKIYAGGGMDMIIEPNGVIPLPVVEGGISIKPFGFIRKKQQPEPPYTPLSTVDAEQSDPVFAHIPENQIVEENEKGKTIRLLNAVYFWADSTVFIEGYLPLLDQAGNRLRNSPDLNIILRGYAAPFGTEAGQLTLSAARAWRCAEYLMSMGIAEERMNMEFYGAEKTPEWANANWESWRCVELLISEQ
jgi:outer membrane protein OmpA-like peptidoglycan-associated protein